ncbi:CRISPR-associated endonuclease Cas2 [Pseudothermotoga sp. U03pept]|uniref:CRISPR-associated endonuclease Cas2 n=1 Tax=Pseudothermotoga sp. U03pept TaxID=3447012 RepID=UPI003F0D6F76
MAYFIVTYDVSESRVNKVRKILKKYFMWVQNSVFEGEINYGKLEQCKRELMKIINCEEDSIYFYEVGYPKNLTKQIIGLEKELTDNFL